MQAIDNSTFFSIYSTELKLDPKPETLTLKSAFSFDGTLKGTKSLYSHWRGTRIITKVRSYTSNHCNILQNHMSLQKIFKVTDKTDKTRHAHTHLSTWTVDYCTHGPVHLSSVSCDEDCLRQLKGWTNEKIFQNTLCARWCHAPSVPRCEAGSSR